MAAITTNASGEYLFLALETSGGNQIIAKAATTDLSTWTAAYQPGTGSAANILPVPGNADLMLFYGNFGTDIVLVRHTISTGANEDISPASLGSNVVNALAVNPSNAAEIVIAVNGAQDIMYTADGGANWATWDSLLGFDATALALLWSGDYDYHRYFAAGVLITDAQLLYTPNEGYSTYDYTGTMTVANVTNLEWTEENQL